MTNHEHLFVQTPEPNLAAGMQFLNDGYAQPRERPLSSPSFPPRERLPRQAG